MRLLESIIFNFIKPFLWLVGRLCPRKKGFVVFAQAKGRYSDNSRALFEWLVAHSSVRVAWLYSGKDVSSVTTSETEGLIVRRDSLLGLWSAVRADVVVVSHGFNDFGPWKHIVRSSKVIVLWHAISVKSVGLTDQKLSNRAKRRFKRKESRDVDAIISSSEVDRYHVASYMGIDINRVHVTGLPRHDAVMREKRRLNELGSEIASPKKLPLKILYAPTFRDRQTDRDSLFFPFDDYEEEVIGKGLAGHQMQVWLRPHPNDMASIDHAALLSNRYPNTFVSATSAEYQDVNDILPQFDAVITDYSSIFLDLLPFDVPCIFVPVDLENYCADRGLGYPYNLIAPGPHVWSQADFLVAIAKLESGLSEWKSHRDFVRRMLVNHADGESCRRVAGVVESLIDL